MKESTKWFRDMHSGKMSFDDAVREVGGRRTAPRPGSMMTYRYNAKTKDKLPIWDVYPLIVFLEKTINGWYGLNLHYLPPEARQAILQEVNKKNNNLGKIVQLLSSNPSTAVCLKRYLASQVVGKVVTVPRTKWHMAVGLPYQKFIKRK